MLIWVANGKLTDLSIAATTRTSTVIDVCAEGTVELALLLKP